MSEIGILADFLLNITKIVEIILLNGRTYVVVGDLPIVLQQSNTTKQEEICQW